MNKINWLQIFETLDIETIVNPTAYITTSVEQKRNYYNKASFSLTLQFLLGFKKDTIFFSDKRKLQYITSLNLPKPQISNSESPLFNQTTFNAKRNYYEFINDYKGHLMKTTKGIKSYKPFMKIDPEHGTSLPYEIEPIEGYETPTNKETGEQFPNCCSFHKKVFEGAEKSFASFPNCCDHHRAMANEKWFKKENYKGISDKIVKQLSYTEHHISERIDKQDWYKDITDYIVYNYYSFGLPEIGWNHYSKSLTHFVQDLKSEKPKDKIQRLVEFIESYNLPKEAPKADLNILYSTYQKWLKIFPFEISYFTLLKPHFEKQLPIMRGKPEVNRYLGIEIGKMHTKSSLIELLINTTKNLLDKVNIPELRKKRAITDLQATQLEFVEASLKTKATEITKQFSKGELKYIKALKKWLQIHKEYFNEITPFLKALPPQQTETASKIPAKYYALFHWIQIEMGSEKDFERNDNNQYFKSKIESFAKERYPQTNSQGFYKEYIGMDITNKIAIARTFGKGYKKMIIDLSMNDSNVINHLKDYPE